MFSCFKKSEKKILLREVYSLSRCLMLNWPRRHAFIYVTKPWNLWLFFCSFSKVVAQKYLKNILQEMKNGLSLRQQQLQLIMQYIITRAFHKLTCRQNKCIPTKPTILSFFFNSKRYRDFSWATILKRLLSDSPFVPQSISYYKFLFDDSSDPFKQRMAITLYIWLTMFVHLQSLLENSPNQIQ